MEVPYIYLETRSRETDEPWVTNFRLYIQSASLARKMFRHGTMGLPDDVSDDVDCAIATLSRNNFTEDISSEEVAFFKMTGRVLTLPQFQSFSASWKTSGKAQAATALIGIMGMTLSYMIYSEATLGQSVRLIGWLR